MAQTEPTGHSRPPPHFRTAPTSAGAGPPTLQVTIIGAGFAGIAQAVQLKRHLGSKVSVQVIEKAAGPGGIWRSSTWPGAQVGEFTSHQYGREGDRRPRRLMGFSVRSGRRADSPVRALQRP